VTACRCRTSSTSAAAAAATGSVRSPPRDRAWPPRWRAALIVNRELSSLEEPVRSEVRALRREHERAIRAIIEEGREAGRFDVDSPALASFAILEMGVSVARWFRPDGSLSAEAVAEEYADFAVRIVGAART
jgi:hypothetical protein